MSETLAPYGRKAKQKPTEALGDQLQEVAAELERMMDQLPASAATARQALPGSHYRLASAVAEGLRACCASLGAAIEDLSSVRHLLQQEAAPQQLPDTCFICGCVDDNCEQCIEASGGPCSWVAPDLCSRCFEEAAERHAKESTALSPHTDPALFPKEWKGKVPRTIYATVTLRVEEMVQVEEGQSYFCFVDSGASVWALLPSADQEAVPKGLEYFALCPDQFTVASFHGEEADSRPPFEFEDKLDEEGGQGDA